MIKKYKLTGLFLALLILVSNGDRCQVAAQDDPVKDMFNRINAARLAQGLVPYALNEALTTAAARHSKDMAATGKVDHTGSDQSSFRERIRAAGYGQWAFGPIVNESVYGGTGGVEIAFDWWMNSDATRGQVLSTRYREVGIAAAAGANGWTYWTLTFGAQPNVLPVFVNDGATLTDKLQVQVTLTNENAVPAGDGVSIMGQPMQVRLGHDEQFADGEWQPWTARLPFSLLPQAGQQRVYVQYRDAQGRTATTWATIALSRVPAGQGGTPTSGPSHTPQPLPTDTPSSSQTPSPTETPVLTGTAPAETPGATATPAARAATPTSTRKPTASPQPAAFGTATVTRTPRPRPQPRPIATPTNYFVSLNGGTPPPALAPTWLILQGLAAVLGLVVLVRKSRR